MRIFATILFVLSFATLAKASVDFPFSVVRDQTGKLERIEIPSQTALTDNQENLLTQLRTQLNSGTDVQGIFSESGLSTDEQKVFAKAKTSLLNSVSLSELNNPLLDQEFTRALPKLKEIKVYRLIASPYDHSAFDQENAISEIVNQVLSAAEKSLQGPTYTVFEFLVNETLESLESRREFHQNRLLVWLDQQPNMFTEEERNNIRSSIFYSRLGFLDILNRQIAQNSWSTYGNNQYSSLVKKCDGFVSQGEEHFGNCFKVSEKQILNKLVKRSSFSKLPSVSYDFDKSQRVRNTRAVLILLKLTLKFVPGPSIVKNEVHSWLESQYIAQRRTEGVLYESLRLQQMDDLAQWVLVNSANPLIIPNKL